MGQISRWVFDVVVRMYCPYISNGKVIKLKT